MVIWNESEINILIDNYPKIGPSKCMNLINKKIYDIKNKAKELDLKFKEKVIFSDDEVLFLKDNYGKLGGVECGVILNKPDYLIYKKIKELGLKSDKIWSSDDIELLNAYYPLHGVEYCFELLKTRSRQSIIAKACELKLKAASSIWKDDEVKFLLENYENEDMDFIVNSLPHNKSSILAKVFNLGIKRKNTAKSTNLRKLFEDNNINEYWYGFIMADGHIRDEGSLSISVSEIDKNHLEKLKNYLNLDRELRYLKSHEFKSPNGKIYTANTAYELVVSDIKYGKLIKEKLCIVGQKTYIPPSLERLKTKEQFISFFCGFSDGDGSINKRKGDLYTLRIQCHASWVDNFYFFQSKFEEFLKIKTIVSVRDNASFFSINSTFDLMKLKKEICALNLPYLERKWDKIIYRNPIENNFHKYKEEYFNDKL